MNRPIRPIIKFIKVFNLAGSIKNCRNFGEICLQTQPFNLPWQYYVFNFLIKIIFCSQL